MARFYVPPGTIRSGEIELGADIAKRINRVLRLNPGDTVILFDGLGQEYLVRILRVGLGKVSATLVEEVTSRPEPVIAVHLYQGLVRLPRFEWALEKGTELGVTSFVPVVSERSVVRPHEQTPARLERWRRIVAEAAEQSGRVRVPEVHPPQPLPLALVDAPGFKIIPWEEADQVSLRDILHSAGGAMLLQSSGGGSGRDRPTVSLFIGPEGGYSRREVELARRHGAVIVSLGRRILRAETAGIFSVAAVLYELGDLG